MQQRSLRGSLVLITLLGYVLLGESATVPHIAFIKDNKIRTKCNAVKHETRSKPIVLMRLTKQPLNELNYENQIVSEDEEYADSNELTGQGQLSYTLVELSKKQVQNLLNRGQLQLMRSGGMNEAQVGIQMYNANTEDLYDEDADFDYENGEMYLKKSDVLYDEDGRTRRQPWRRYFRKIIRRVIG